MEKIIDYKAKPGKCDTEYMDHVRKGVEFYIKKSEKIKNGDYKILSISEAEDRNYGCDIEASYLCHGVWDTIMENEETPCRNNSFNWKRGEKEMVFHYDIMNNPNNKRNKGCVLANCDHENVTEWKELYHTIGNMTPTPWFRIYKKNAKSIDAQGMHKVLDERWDLFLQLLQNNWSWLNRHNDKSITFIEYMELTCQQMYFKGVYERIVQDKCLVDFESIDAKEIETWNDIIKDNNELIAFSEEKDEAVDMINNLIKIRCKVIEVKLRENIGGDSSKD